MSTLPQKSHPKGILVQTSNQWILFTVHVTLKLSCRKIE